MNVEGLEIKVEDLKYNEPVLQSYEIKITLDNPETRCYEEVILDIIRPPIINHMFADPESDVYDLI